MSLLAALAHSATAATSSVVDKPRGTSSTASQGVNRGSEGVARGLLWTTEGRRRRTGGLGLRAATKEWELGVANVRAAKERGPPSANLVNDSNVNGRNKDLGGDSTATSLKEVQRTDGRYLAEAPPSAGGARMRGGQGSQAKEGTRSYATA